MVISVRQSTVAAISGLRLPGAGYGQFEHKADSLIAVFKEAAEWSERFTASRSQRDYLLLCYPYHRLPVYGLLIITVITPLPTKPSATKMPENWKLANAAITDMQMRQRDVKQLDAKYTKELGLMLKLKMMLCGCMLPLVVVGCTSKQSVSQCASHHGPAWITQPPRLADTAERDYFTLRDEADHYAKKQLKGTQKYINEQCR